MAEYFVYIGLGTAGLFFLMWLYQKKEGQLILPIVSSLVRSLSYWKFDKENQARIDQASEALDLVISKTGPIPLESRKEEVATYLATHIKSDDPAATKRFSMTLYILILESPTLVRLLSDFKQHENLDVKRITVLLIDILGQLFDRSDKLSREYFQALIVGLNKALILVRDRGYTQKNIKELSALLFRVYRITQAYLHQQSNKGLTEAEFYEKVSGTIDRFLRTAK